MAARPTTFESAKDLGQTLIDHGIDLDEVTTVPRPQKDSGGKKKKSGNKQKGQSSQEPSKKQQIVVVHVATAPAAAPTAVPTTQSSTGGYAGKLSLCTKCNFHHHGPCRELICNNCGKKGHTTRYCKTPAQPTNQAPGAGAGQTCYGCGEAKHYRRNCPKATTGGNTGRVLAMGQNEAVADPTVVTGTFLLDNSYACILFDSGAERSFVSHSFKHLIKCKSQPLTETFTVKMANGKKESTNDIFIGCTLTLDNYSFPIDLMPVSIKSFDVIIDMGWLSSNHADILYFEKNYPPQSSFWRNPYDLW